MMTVEQIVDRDSYLDYRDEWAANYNCLSDMIRMARGNRYKASNSFAHVEATVNHRSKGFYQAYRSQLNCQRDLIALRRCAREMMLKLEEAKASRPPQHQE